VLRCWRAIIVAEAQRARLCAAIICFCSTATDAAVCPG
jgi:hypothetical protein